MPSTKNTLPLLSDKYYHIFNRGVDHMNLFNHQNDYTFFLVNFKHTLGQLVDTYAYCLLPNHFHLLIKVKEDNRPELNRIVSNEFRKLFICHSTYYNNKYSRDGALFLRPFKRINIVDDIYLKRLVFYIHFNPQKHEIIDDYRGYKYSSFRAFRSANDTQINRSEVLSWFNNDMMEFFEFHDYLHDEKVISPFLLEE